MQDKIRNKITKRPIKRVRSQVSSKIVADVVGCAPCTVIQVQKGIRSADTYTGERILVASMILEEGFEKLILKTKKQFADENN